MSDNSTRAITGGRVVPVRLSDDLLSATDELARTSGDTRSEVIRTALRTHLTQRAAGTTSPPRLTPAQHAQLLEICTRYGVATLEVFGSTVRGEATASSDIDLLYTLQPGVRLGWEIDDLADELASALGRPVDLTARRALHDRLRGDVLAEAQVLYVA